MLSTPLLCCSRSLQSCSRSLQCCSRSLQCCCQRLLLPAVAVYCCCCCCCLLLVSLSLLLVSLSAAVRCGCSAEFPVSSCVVECCIFVSSRTSASSNFAALLLCRCDNAITCLRGMRQGAKGKEQGQRHPRHLELSFLRAESLLGYDERLLRSETYQIRSETSACRK